IADNNNNNYALGKIRKYNIIMAILPKSKYSITSTATIARDILHSFLNIHFGLIVSISSGILSIKYNICLSDIIVSTCSNRKGGVF
ncbi:hypothetical protein IWW34DRAFT_631022, partial [Fusarium oxysporum f. sp. albedinis]